MIKKLLNNKFSKDLMITVIGQVILMLLALVINKINSVQLGEANYSVFNVAKKSVGIISGIMAASLGIALPRYISMKEYNSKKGRLLISSLFIMMIISFVTLLIMFILRNWFSVVIFGNTNYENLIMPMVLYSFSVAFSTIIYSYYRGCNKYYWYNGSQMAVNVAMLVIALLIPKSILLILLFWGISTLVITIIFMVLILREVKDEFKDMSFPKKEIKMLSSFGLPRIIGEIALFSFTTVPLIIIAHRDGIESNFLISVPVNISAMIFPVFSFAGVILLPYVSSALSENDLKRINKPIFYMALLYIIAALGASIIISLFPEFIIGILFADGYKAASVATTIMIWSLLPASIYYLLRNPIDALSRIPFNTINLVISFAFICGILFVSNNTKEYALAFVIGYSILCILSIASFMYCKRRASLKGGLVK